MVKLVSGGRGSVFITFMRKLPLSSLAPTAVHSEFSHLALISRPGRSQGLLYKHLCCSFIHWLIHPLVCHARLVRDGSSSYKINYVIVTKNSLNPKWHQNTINNSKVMAILLKGRILPIGGASAGEGLRLHPAQQACSCFEDCYVGRTGNMSMPWGQSFNHSLTSI